MVILENFPAHTLLISDVDGTLVSGGLDLPRRNLTALERFIRGGGLFALATGRSAASAGKFAARTGVNAPCILLNGSIIYDFGTRKVLWQAFLPPEVGDVMRTVMARFPEVGAEVYAEGNFHLLNENPWTREHAPDKILGYVHTRPEDVPSGWNKALFTGEAGKLAQVQRLCESLPHPGWDYVYSGPLYYEMLPTGVSKGSTAKKLAEICKIPHNRVVAIGDYFNDYEMVAGAGFSAVPEDSPQALRAAAGMIAGPCERGAVADLIEYLENQTSPTGLPD